MHYTSVRLDLWLWAARFYKTRSLAKQALDNGRISLRGQRAKPASPLRIGDRLDIQRGEERFEIDVLRLSEQRGPASVAATLYAETESSRERRALQAEARRQDRQGYTPPPQRPNSQDRRKLVGLRRG